MSMLKVKARWTGFSGAPGYSVFHFSKFDTSGGWVAADATTAAAAVRAFFEAIKEYLPSVVNVAVQTDVEVIDQASGNLTDVLTATVGASSQGQATVGTAYVAAAGAVVTWRTSQVRLGRRIRGRTFLVPLSMSAFENNGSLGAGALTSINTAATALRATGSGPVLGVFARPPVAGIGAGEWAPVSGHSVPDMGAVMRSRRD